MKDKFKLGIVIFACDKIEKYREQVRTLRNTWVKKAKEFPDIKVLFFFGEETTEEFTGEDYVNLKGVGDDCCSVHDKNYDGIKYFYDNYDCDFVYCCGTDTYINIPKLYKIIDNFNPADRLYIGGCGMNFTLGNNNYYFHSGGTGFILTKGVIADLVPLINTTLFDDWDKLCKSYGNYEASYLSDVSIGYFARNVLKDVYTIDVENKVFYSDNYKHLSDGEREKSIICHFMQPQDVCDYDKIMEDNNFFLHNSAKINIQIIPT